MTVAPFNSYRVVAHRFDVQHLERGLEHLKGSRGGRIIALPRLGAVRPGAGGAGTLVPQVAQRILAVVTVLPVDLYSLRFRDRDVFGFRYGFNHWVRSTSRTPE